MKPQFLVAVAVVTLAGSQAQAQSSSLFGNRGVTAGSGTMSNGVGGQGNNSNQSGGFGNSGSMTGFTGATSGSQTGFLSGAGVGSGLAGMSNSGNFVGNRNLTGQGGAPGATGRQGGLGGGRNGLQGGRNSLSNIGRSNNSQRNRANQGRGAASGAQSTPIRPVQVIAFAPPQRSSETIKASIDADIESAVSQGRMQGVAVNINAEGIATVEGHVATESERRKAERLVQLEPGVRKVVNRITVSQQP